MDLNIKMRRRRDRWGAVLLLLALLPSNVMRTMNTAQADTMEKPGWKLTFHDEFDGSSLDATKWDDYYWHGRTHSNNELYYSFPI